MKTKALKLTKTILVVAIVGFALTALTGCGISHGPHRYGYDGQNYYRSGHVYQNNPSSVAPKYDPGNRGYGPMIGYGHSRSGYCTW